MSDPASSGDPSGASAATAGPASPAASSGHPAPIGSFGTAKGSGLLRGKRPSAPAASAASSPAPSGYQPSTIEVIRPQSEYKNPFTGETSVPAAVVNEPSSAKAAEGRPAPSPAPVAVVPAAAPAASSVASAKEDAPIPTPAPAPAMDGELFPFTLNELSAAKPALPSVVPPSGTKEGPKAELNILPTEEVKRPAVSWGESTQHGEPRTRRDERPTFRPERREPRPFEPREPRREPAAGEPRPERSSSPRDFSRDDRPAPAATPKQAGGFVAWLKGLFGAKPASPEVRSGDRDEHGRDGDHRHNRRRHRGGRGRGGFNGENRGPREQPRDPRDETGPSSQGGEPSGERRYEGGGRRRHRGGRGRNRDDRGPRPEGQQGGGAI